MNEPISVDIKRAAELTGVGVDTITTAIKSGRLRAKRSGKDKNGDPAGKHLVSVAALRDWFEQLEDA